MCGSCGTALLLDTKANKKARIAAPQLNCICRVFFYEIELAWGITRNTRTKSHCGVLHRCSCASVIQSGQFAGDCFAV